MKKIFCCVFFLVISLSAQAGMTWTAIAVPYDKLPQLRGSEELLLETLESKDGLDIDKAWDGLRYLLQAKAGNEALARQLFFGGQHIGADLGNGPARVLMPAEVKKLAAMLERESAAALTARYAPKAMEAAQVYPQGIWESEGPEALAYLLHYYEALRGYFKQAAVKGQAVVVVIW